MKQYISWSGGKDSTASIIIAYEKNIPCDGVVMSEVMFDHSRNISGENPDHISWVYNVAKPTIERMGFSVIIVRDERDYLSLFNHRILYSKVPERVGKKAGFLIGGMCKANDYLKMAPLRKFLRGASQIVGIARDEHERLSRLQKKKNCRSLLAEYNFSECDCYYICKGYGLLSPIYDHATRSGCWFCPNQRIEELALLQKQHPELWNELVTLACDKDIVSPGFKYGETIPSIARQIYLINNQLSFL